MATKKSAAKSTTSAKARPAKKQQKSSNQYWFAAKRYGWGWGRAATWQGWLVYLGFLAVIVSYIIWANDKVLTGETSGLSDTAFFVTGLAVVLAVSVPVLVTICLMKGEAPKWRWGNKRK